MEISGLNIRKKAGLTPATPEQQSRINFNYLMIKSDRLIQVPCSLQLIGLF